MFKRARRLADVAGFGIDRVAAAADRAAQANPAWPVLRMENLDTDLPLPPEAIPVTVESLETPPANSWLPFTGDHSLCEAISDFLAERTGHRYDPEREIVITSGTSRCSTTRRWSGSCSTDGRSSIRFVTRGWPSARWSSDRCRRSTG